MEKLVFRPINSADNREIASIIRRALEEFGANKPGTVYTDPETDQLYELFQKPKSHYIIAEFQGEVIGGAGIFQGNHLPENTTELVKLYLKKEFRNRGIGRKLIEQCVQLARREGYQFLYLETMNELKDAVDLYVKTGFRQLEQGIGDSGHFACEIQMLMPL